MVKLVFLKPPSTHNIVNHILRVKIARNQFHTFNSNKIKLIKIKIRIIDKQAFIFW